MGIDVSHSMWFLVAALLGTGWILFGGDWW